MSEPIHPRLEVERLPNVIARTGMRRSWIYAHVADGTFPQPLKLSRGAIGWLSSDIDDWLISKRFKPGRG